MRCVCAHSTHYGSYWRRDLIVYSCDDNRRLLASSAPVWLNSIMFDPAAPIIIVLTMHFEFLYIYIYIFFLNLCLIL